MILSLKGGKKFVPSGLAWTEPRTGRIFCGYELSVEGLVAKVIEHRLRNERIYPRSETAWFDPESVKQEFFRHVFSRKPELFNGFEAKPLEKLVNVGAGILKCPKCGSTTFLEQHCATCSGKRVIGRKCKECGFHMSV